MSERAALVSVNWETEEVLHQLCKDQAQAFGLLLSIKDDFPKKEGWTHHVIGKVGEDAMQWLKRNNIL